MKRYLTPTQLLILTFSFMLSGLFEAGHTDFFAVLFELLIFLLAAVLGMRGARRAAPSFSSFCAAYGGERGGAFLAVTFAALSVLPMLQTALRLTDTAWGLSPFLPRYVILITVFAIAINLSRRGMTAVGRMAELSLFLLIPMLFICPFGDFLPHIRWTSPSTSEMTLSVTAAPILFLASRTVTAGDADATPAMRAGGKVPKDRSAYLVRILIGAGVAASLVYVYFSLFSFGNGDVFRTVFLWMLLSLRLATLLGIVLDPILCAKTSALRFANTAILAASLVSAAAALGKRPMGISETQSVLTLLGFLLAIGMNLLPSLESGKKRGRIQFRE